MKTLNWPSIVLAALGLLIAPALFAGEIATIEWRELHDRDVSAFAQQLLERDKEVWKHAETEHFVYHFKDPKDAEMTLERAEVYYGWVKDQFGIQEDVFPKKCHIFLFGDEPTWLEVKKAGGVGIEGDAYTTGGELYMYRSAFWLSPQKALAHEITHIVLYRFLGGPVPLAVNEGAAEFVSARALATQFGGNEYDVRTLKLLKPEEFRPLRELASTDRYPEGENVLVFYREAELFVRFLILEKGKQAFYAWLQQLAAGKDLDSSLSEIYGRSFEELESQLKQFSVAKN